MSLAWVALFACEEVATAATADDVMILPIRSPQLDQGITRDYGILQNFGKLNGAHGGYHTGLDLTTNVSAYGAIGKDVFAALDGTVECVNTDTDNYRPGSSFPENSYPGRVVVVRHVLANHEEIYLQYGHLDWCNDHSIACPKTGDTIHRGDLVGTMISQNGNTHLHFEVRKHRHFSYLLPQQHATDEPLAPHGDPKKAIGCAGPGYYIPDLPATQGWMNPLEFYFERAHRSFPVAVFAWTKEAVDIRATPSDSGQALGQLARAAGTNAKDVVRDQSYVPGTTSCEADPADTTGACDWWYRVDYQGRDAYIKAFARGSYGSKLSVFEDPDGGTVPVATPSVAGENRGGTNHLVITPVPSGGTVDVQRRDGGAPSFLTGAFTTVDQGARHAGVTVPSDGVDATYDDSGIAAGSSYCYQATVTVGGITSQLSNEVCLAAPALDCSCAGGVDSQGNPIDAADTYCGLQVCGTDYQAWQCTASGWTATHTACGGNFTCPPIGWSNSCGEQQSGVPQQLVCNPYDDLYRCDWGPGDPPDLGHWDLLQISGCQEALGRICVPQPDSFYVCPTMTDACGVPTTGDPNQMICGDATWYECLRGGTVTDGSWVEEPGAPPAWVARPDLGSCSLTCRSDANTYVCPEIESNACGEPESGTPQSLACNPYNDVYQCVQGSNDPFGSGHWELLWIGNCLELLGQTCDGT